MAPQLKKSAELINPICTKIILPIKDILVANFGGQNNKQRDCISKKTKIAKTLKTNKIIQESKEPSF